MPSRYDLPAPGRRLTPSAIDQGAVAAGRVEFINWRGEADRPEPPPPAPLPPQAQVGFAIAGLGRLALGQILPAFAACKLARPVALISDSADKARLVAGQYGINPEHVMRYEEMSRLREIKEVNAVYVVTPNGLHLEHVKAAAGAGKHVLCEKLMANTSAEAREMTDACAAAKVKLMVAYRCQYDPYNRHVIDLIQGGDLGWMRLIEASNTQVQSAA
jgi:predicted dehydrogenase